MQKRPALLVNRSISTLARLLEALSAFEPRRPGMLFEILRGAVGTLGRLSRIQPDSSNLPGNGGIDNLPKPESNAPGPPGCLSALTALISRQTRSK